MSFPVIFQFIPGEISAEKNCLEHFYGTKRFGFEFQGGLLSYFWAIRLISAVISILDDFGSLLSARTMTVKMTEIGKSKIKIGVFYKLRSFRVLIRKSNVSRTNPMYRLQFNLC